MPLLNIGTQGVRELFFCDLKLPGGCSTQWTLKSYDKGNSFTYTGPGFPAFNVIIEFSCTIFLYKLWWLLSLNILQRFFRTTLFLLSLFFSWYPNEILQTDMPFPNTTLSELVKYRWPWNSPQYSFNKHFFFLFFCKAILSLVQILEGSRLLGSRLPVIPLHHPLHTKMKCFNLTPFNYFAKHLVPSE